MSQSRRLTEELVRLAAREVADAGPMPGFDHFSEADYDEHLDAFLRDRPEGPLHVFAYGSLIWKPVYEPAAAQRATAPGWHRAFCLKVARFRGTIEQPGLMMQLHSGDGAAEGVLHRLDRASEVADLRTLWRREMTVKPPGNVPRWIETVVEGERRPGDRLHRQPGEPQLRRRAVDRRDRRDDRRRLRALGQLRRISAADGHRARGSWHRRSLPA